MSARKKSRFERLLSFNQHRKRFGAAEAAADLKHADLALLKETRIAGDTPTYTHGSTKDIQQHLQQLRAEFAGQSELLYYHAQLIVMIRREYQVKQHYTLFEQLWTSEHIYLLTHLNTRWLVSAADTFVDHASDPLARALALNASTLANTVKMQESERYLQASEATSDDAERLTKLQNQRVALFDGMSAFAVGTDDSLRNLRWRLEAMAELHPLGALALEIFQRLQQHDTVYKRFCERHTRTKTAWW